jgi:hypothetical protein
MRGESGSAITVSFMKLMIERGSLGFSESDIGGRFIGNCEWRYGALTERPGFYHRLFHILDSYETDSMAKKIDPCHFDVSGILETWKLAQKE